MTDIDDAAAAALRVHERHPELSVDVLVGAAVGALEIAVAAEDLDVVIERIALEFAASSSVSP
ncbi:hypothetical protein [Candidatus Solirubrobacter pratensis]|uniref:hypothetical protein n=1 Tax=Candidatus Solirubrobacter pratensis TaxID=1298857 RepID=UPI0012DCBBCB|nr:hypothetical protein [Candidatus Solirubrobacter pratensis]